MFPFFLISGISDIESGALEHNGNRTKKTAGNPLAYRAASRYLLIAKALLELESQFAVPTLVLISRHL